MKKQIKIKKTISKELVGVDIAKYLLSIGYQPKKKENNKVS